MAGWTHYNEEIGEIEAGMYDRPFIVRGTYNFTRGREAESITSFRTREEADKWVAQYSADYLVKPWGFDDIHIENWNE